MVDLDGFKKYLNSTSLSDKTKETYVSSLEHYSNYFKEISTENVQSYKKLCLQKYKPSTINLRLHALQKYSEFKKTPVDISYIKIQEPLFSENVMSRHDYEKILNYLLDKKQYDWYVIFRLLGTTGLRIEESKQVCVGDLKGCRKTILGKGTKTRVIWFPLSMRKEIMPLLKGKKDSDKIVCHDEGYIRKKLRDLQKQLKIKVKLSPHEFRRFYAREVYSKTKDVYLVKDLLGHSSVQTTMRYLRINISSISRRMSKLVDW